MQRAAAAVEGWIGSGTPIFSVVALDPGPTSSLLVATVAAAAEG